MLALLIGSVFALSLGAAFDHYRSACRSGCDDALLRAAELALIPLSKGNRRLLP